MKQSLYRAEIIERFMTNKEQSTFDEKYRNARVVRIGADVASTVRTSDKKKLSLRGFIKKVI